MSNAPKFDQYRRSQIAEGTAWMPGLDMARVSVSASDREAGSPKPGDMIFRNPKNHADQWLVAKAYFEDNFEPMPETITPVMSVAQVRHAVLKAIYDETVVKGADAVNFFEVAEKVGVCAEDRHELFRALGVRQGLGLITEKNMTGDVALTKRGLREIDGWA